jgi:4'-phosphopantetheinyl transferase
MKKQNAGWLLLKDIPAFDTEAIQVWYASNQPPWIIENLSRVLSKDELFRAKQYHFEKDYARFIISHGILRILLGQYHGIDPARLIFQTEPSGKPISTPSVNHHLIHFNISHSNELCLFAFSADHQVGVDIEFIKPMDELDAISARYFTPYERSILQELDEGKKLEAFYTLWTCKEAFIKAAGKGLQYPLEKVEILTNNTEIPEVRINKDLPEAVHHWSAQILSLNPQYKAAVIYEGPTSRVIQTLWQI